jgi:hypothetical protein
MITKKLIDNLILKELNYLHENKNIIKNSKELKVFINKYKDAYVEYFKSKKSKEKSLEYILSRYDGVLDDDFKNSNEFKKWFKIPHRKDDILEAKDDIKVKNPETGRMVNATTILNYGHNHPAYKAAKKALGHEDADTVSEPTGVHPKDKKSFDNAVSKTKRSLSIIKNIGVNKTATSAMKTDSEVSSELSSLYKSMDALSKSDKPQTKKNAIKYTKQIVDVLNKEINDTIKNKQKDLSPSLEKTLRNYQKMINDKHKQIEKNN